MIHLPEAEVNSDDTDKVYYQEREGSLFGLLHFVTISHNMLWKKLY